MVTVRRRSVSDAQVTIEQDQLTVTHRGLRQKEAAHFIILILFSLFIITDELSYGIIAIQINSPNTALLSREAEGTALRCLDNQSMKIEYGAKSDR